MKVLMINSVCGIRSTGRICTDIANALREQGHEVKIAYGRLGQVPESVKSHAVRIGTNTDSVLHALGTRIMDAQGFCSGKATKRFLQWAEAYDPDMVWLHNIHGYYIQVEQLFAWIKSRPNMKVLWTLHDCWPFTGHCAYFDYAKCEKWMTGCHECPQKGCYPASVLFDRSKENYKRKQAAFTGVKDLTLITPSQWLADLVQKSFLKEYTVEVRHNQIDSSVFCPTPGSFREKYGLENKTIVLGVASIWDARKGLDDFYKLSEQVDENIKIVLVGVDKGQMKKLPKNVLGIPKTNNAKELAEIYTAADVFFNPTYEDNYPTVNLEAQACGTYVITYRSGGAAETIYREDAMVVEQGDLGKVLQLIKDRSKA
jgi:glycosyltransferase involved in cell wall biosynthesis